jgi:hypothetical protein
LWTGTLSTQSELVGQVKDIDVDFLYKGNSNWRNQVCLGHTWYQRKDLLLCGQTSSSTWSKYYSKALMAISELAQYGDINIEIKGSARVRSGQLLWAKIPVQTTTTAKTLYSYFS